MKALDGSPPILGTLPSPGSSNFLDTNVGYSAQSWSSERVPMTASSLYKRRQTSLSSMMLHHSGRTVPSKWEDAERWITSPTSNAFICNRRPMSRSGPIGQSKAAYYSNDSPNFQGFQSGKAGFSLAIHRSPISSGLMLEATNHLQTKYENGVQLSTGVSGFSDLLSESSSTESSQDTKLEQYVDGNGEVSRRDMATQMSPASCYSSSSKGWPASIKSAKETNFDSSNKNLEAKDVHVDKWATVLRWPKRKDGSKQGKRDPPQVVDLYKTIFAKPEAGSPAPRPAPASPWDVAALAKKYEREEAKITAWENLQKAKSEAAVRKLEMNLERKRSKSMEKIIKEFKKAEKKSQKMRKILADEQARSSAQIDKAVKETVRVSHFPVSIHVGSFSCCFTGHRL